MVAGIPLYVVLRISFVRWRLRKLGIKEKPIFDKLRELFLGGFVLFMMALLVFVWQGVYRPLQELIPYVRDRIQNGYGINLTPFRTIRGYYRVFGPGGDLFMVNILGNVLIFVPWGFGLAFLWKKNRSFHRLFFFSLMLPVFIEFTQLFIARQVDVDDVMLNFLGGMLGGLCFQLLGRICPGAKDIALAERSDQKEAVPSPEEAYPVKYCRGKATHCKLKGRKKTESSKQS